MLPKFPRVRLSRSLDFLQKPAQSWQNQSIRFKLTALLLTTTALSVFGVAHAVLEMSEHHFEARLQLMLNHQAKHFGDWLDAIADDHLAKAIALSKGVEMAELDLNDPAAIARRQQKLEQLFSNPAKTEFEPSFLIITDVRGRTIAKRIQILAEPERELFLPAPNEPHHRPHYRTVDVPTGIDLGQLPIVRAAIDTEQPLASTELLPQSILQSLGLGDQADLPLRSQPLTGAIEKQPLPYHQLDRNVGMVKMAVVPIRSGDQVIGTAIVGTLLNRNFAVVDAFREVSDVSAVTLFALDKRISTNVPYHTGKSRALGTLVAREVAQSVLFQNQSFSGKTMIVGESYYTVYKPIYDHRKQLSPNHSKPIGMYFVGNSEAKIDQLLIEIAIVGYSIGAAILVLVAIIMIPISNRFSLPLRRLRFWAEQIGKGAKSVPIELEARNDEVGVLARSLSQMTQRLERNLAIVQASEEQIREQATTLEQTLQELQQTQAKLIQSEKISGLGQLVAGVAHEINNPISFIYGNVNYTQQYIDDLLRLIEAYQQAYSPKPEIQKLSEEIDLNFIQTDLPKTLDSMKQGANRIREIVLSLRTFSRMDEASYKAVNIHTGLDSSLSLLQHRLGTIQIIKHYATLPEVECYAAQLNQVFMGILTNAIEALNTSNHSAPTIWIQTEQIDDAIAISIKNNGDDIPPEIQSRIFDPFFTTKPVGQGTGMGLAVSYQIVVDQHQGKLVCRSQPNEGVEFIIQIPLKQSTPESQIALAQSKSLVR